MSHEIMIVVKIFQLFHVFYVLFKSGPRKSPYSAWRWDDLPSTLACPSSLSSLSFVWRCYFYIGKRSWLVSVSSKHTKTYRNVLGVVAQQVELLWCQNPTSECWLEFLLLHLGFSSVIMCLSKQQMTAQALGLCHSSGELGGVPGFGLAHPGLLGAHE